MPENRQASRTLGYSLNVFPCNSLAELWTCLETEVEQLKELACPNGVFPVELRFSERIVRDLQIDCDAVSRLKYHLDTHDLALVSVNGFVMPAFQGERVKERVYLPAWHESDARVNFTIACLDLLQTLGTQALGHSGTILSVSVPFGALKPVSMAAIAPNILRCGRHAEMLRQKTGVHCVVALEPEPGLTVETTAEAVEFFERFVPATLRPYLGVNFDLSHQLVEFEDLGASLARLSDHGVPVAKVHVSNAAEMTRLEPFYADSIYLHQVCGVNARRERVYFSLDWPTQPPPADIRLFRVHYHLPVCPQPDSPVATTLNEVEDFLRHSGTLALGNSTPFIIETYTWPEHRPGRLVEGIAGELAWVREKMCLCSPGV